MSQGRRDMEDEFRALETWLKNPKNKSSPLGEPPYRAEDPILRYRASDGRTVFDLVLDSGRKQDYNWLRRNFHPLTSYKSDVPQLQVKAAAWDQEFVKSYQQPIRHTQVLEDRFQALEVFLKERTTKSQDIEPLTINNTALRSDTDLHQYVAKNGRNLLDLALEADRKDAFLFLRERVSPYVTYVPSNTALQGKAKAWDQEFLRSRQSYVQQAAARAPRVDLTPVIVQANQMIASVVAGGHVNQMAATVMAIEVQRLEDNNLLTKATHKDHGGIYHVTPDRKYEIDIRGAERELKAASNGRLTGEQYLFINRLDEHGKPKMVGGVQLRDALVFRNGKFVGAHIFDPVHEASFGPSLWAQIHAKQEMALSPGAWRELGGPQEEPDHLLPDTFPSRGASPIPMTPVQNEYDDILFPSHMRVSQMPQAQPPSVVEGQGWGTQVRAAAPFSSATITSDSSDGSHTLSPQARKGNQHMYEDYHPSDISQSATYSPIASVHAAAAYDMASPLLAEELRANSVAARSVTLASRDLPDNYPHYDAATTMRSGLSFDSSSSSSAHLPPLPPPPPPLPPHHLAPSPIPAAPGVFIQQQQGPRFVGKLQTINEAAASFAKAASPAPNDGPPGPSVTPVVVGKGPQLFPGK